MERTAHFGMVRRKAPAHCGGAGEQSLSSNPWLVGSQRSRPACAASSEAMQTELARLLVTLEMWWNCTRSDKEEQKGNERFQRALLPLNLVTVDSFTVINSLTSSFCDKWGRTDWTRWLIYQWIASFPFKPRPHWWSLWFSTTSWGVYRAWYRFGSCHFTTEKLHLGHCMFLQQTWW